MMLSRRTFRLVAVMLLTQFGATWRVQAQETSIQHLKGLTSIAVHVGIDGPSNISMTQLESAVTQRLRDAGITIVPPKHHGHTAPRDISGRSRGSFVRHRDRTGPSCIRNCACIAPSRSPAAMTEAKQLPGRRRGLPSFLQQTGMLGCETT